MFSCRNLYKLSIKGSTSLGDLQRFTATWQDFPEVRIFSLFHDICCFLNPTTFSSLGLAFPSPFQPKVKGRMEGYIKQNPTLTRQTKWSFRQRRAPINSSCRGGTRISTTDPHLIETARHLQRNRGLSLGRRAYLVGGRTLSSRSWIIVVNGSPGLHKNRDTFIPFLREILYFI